jgi:hypothetical protein
MTEKISMADVAWDQNILGFLAGRFRPQDVEVLLDEAADLLAGCGKNRFDRQVDFV